MNHQRRTDQCQKDSRSNSLLHINALQKIFFQFDLGFFINHTSTQNYFQCHSCLKVQVNLNTNIDKHLPAMGWSCRIGK